MQNRIPEVVEKSHIQTTQNQFLFSKENWAVFAYESGFQKASKNK